MKLGVSAFAWTAAFGPEHLTLLPRVKEYGFDGLELPMFKPSDIPVAELRREFEANDLDCTICAILPDGINPISPEASVRKRSLAHLVECVETAAELGARLLGGPIFAPIGYLPPHRPTPDEWRWAVDIFQSLGDLIERNNIDVSIEPVNRAETFFIRTAAEAKEFCEDIGHPCIGVTLDTFHANIEEKDVPAAIDHLGFHLKHMHISENDRGLIGSGHVDLPGCIAALDRIGYDGYLVVEGFGYSADETSAPGTLWADLNVSPEDIAQQGIACLRELTSGDSSELTLRNRLLNFN
jgi:D-psicose/D-tagatose/L-ribulose 3-epimerase